MLSGTSLQHPIVFKIVEGLALHSRLGRDISFCWIPAHIGGGRNEKVDEVAKASTRLTHIPRGTLTKRNYLQKISQKVWLLGQGR